MHKENSFIWVWAKKFFFLWSFWNHFLVSIAIFLNIGCFRYFKNYKTFDFLMRMLRPLCAHWAYESGTDACTEHTRQELMLTVSIRVRNWCVHWAYESGTDLCTERTYEIWKGPFKTCLLWAYASGTDAYAEHTPKELMRALSVRVRNWCVCSACASEINDS
jgi:hypothetical protein